MNKLICRSCARTFDDNLPIWRCECGGLLDLDLDYKFTIKKITGRKPTLWRYREALPIKNDENIICLDEGFTPMLSVNLCGKAVYVKQDHLFQTGSFKDRGASVLVSKTKELGINQVLIDSSGNAGCAVAAYCASARIKCKVFIPAYTSSKKIAQIRNYGAHLTLIKGTRDDTARAALLAARTTYYASHYWNPYFVHGTKTFAFEVCEQLGWKAPDTVILPAGNGTLLIGAYIGFNELKKQKIITKVPRLIGVQPANCAPLNNILKHNLTKSGNLHVKPTIAEGIAVAEPVRGPQVIQIIKNTNGTIITVTENEIKNTLIELSMMGFYIEPTAAVAIAGTKKYLYKEHCAKEVIVTVFTGHGLKAK